jgi:hypothetical protein
MNVSHPVRARAQNTAVRARKREREYAEPTVILITETA